MFMKLAQDAVATLLPRCALKVCTLCSMFRFDQIYNGFVKPWMCSFLVFHDGLWVDIDIAAAPGGSKAVVVSILFRRWRLVARQTLHLAPPIYIRKLREQT